jgi:hypothetical protein
VSVNQLEGGASVPGQFSLTVVNQSEVDGPVFVVVPKRPQGVGYHALVWLAQQIDQSNSYLFEWELTWGFTWSAAGRRGGVDWSGRGSLPADPSVDERCAATLDYDGDFKLAAADGTEDGERLTVACTARVPLPDTVASTAGVSLSGEPAFAVAAGPNLQLAFPLPSASYYVGFGTGTYVGGQPLDVEALQSLQELDYDGTVTDLTATLQQDNTWSVADGRPASVSGGRPPRARTATRSRRCPR